MKKEPLEINKISSDINAILRKYLFKPNNHFIRNNVYHDVCRILKKYDIKEYGQQLV